MSRKRTKKDLTVDAQIAIANQKCKDEWREGAIRAELEAEKAAIEYEAEIVPTPVAHIDTDEEMEQALKELEVTLQGNSLIYLQVIRKKISSINKRLEGLNIASSRLVNLENFVSQLSVALEAKKFLNTPVFHPGKLKKTEGTIDTGYHWTTSTYREKLSALPLMNCSNCRSGIWDNPGNGFICHKVGAPNHMSNVSYRVTCLMHTSPSGYQKEKLEKKVMFIQFKPDGSDVHMEEISWI